MNNKQILWNSKHGLTLLVISLMFATGRSLPAQMDAGESPAQMFPTNPLFDVNGDGCVDLGDADCLQEQGTFPLAVTPELAAFDFTGDGLLTGRDTQLLLEQIVGVVGEVVGSDGDGGDGDEPGGGVDPQLAFQLEENVLGCDIGDIDIDGDVDMMDFYCFELWCYFEHCLGMPITLYTQFDLDGSKSLDMTDYEIFCKAWERSSTPGFPPPPPITIMGDFDPMNDCQGSGVHGSGS